MRYSILLLLALAALLRAEVKPVPAQFLIRHPQKPVVVDGRLDEWDLRDTPYVIHDSADPLNSVSSNDPQNPLRGDADYCGRAALAWDATYLYVACLVTDDHLVGVKPDSLGNQGPAGWFCDSLMMSVASFRQPMKTNSPYSPNPFLAIRYAVPAVNPRGKLLDDPNNGVDKRDMYWKLPDGSRWGSMETADGYTLEAAVPWSALRYVPRPGERIFIAFLAGDVDPGEALNQIGWAATSEKYGVANDMASHPVFRLADRDDLLGILTVSTDELRANDSWTLRVELDALTKNARLDSVRLVNAKGKTVLTRKIGVDVLRGQRASVVLDFSANLLPPGAYTLEEIARVEGKTVVVGRQ
jgi:hypothetical protein